MACLTSTSVSETRPGKKGVEKLRSHKVLEHRCTALSVSISILLFLCELKSILKILISFNSTFLFYLRGFPLKKKKRCFLSFCLQKPFLSPPFSCPFFLCCLCLLVILALLIKNLVLLVASQRSLLSPTEGWAQDLHWYSVYVLPEACIFKTWTALKLPCVCPASSMNF